MPPISRIRRDHLQERTVWMIAAPLAKTGRWFLWPGLQGDTRREAIAAWQAVYPSYSWRKAYRNGWRVVRVDLHLAGRSTLDTSTAEAAGGDDAAD